MKIRLLLLFTTMEVLLSSCSSNTLLVNPTSTVSTAETRAAMATLTPTPELLQPARPSSSVSENSQVLLYDDWPTEGFPMAAAKITAITLEKNNLKIQVIYQGGCQQHIFELQAWTGFLESNPQQALLYLSHDTHGDTCTENRKNVLSFDLTPLDKSRAGRQANPLFLRVYEPEGGSFAKEPFMPLIEWP